MLAPPPQGEERLFLPLFVVADQLRGDREDRAGAAVILFEPYDLDVLKIFFEFKNVADIRPAPAVDRLVGIAGDRQVGKVARKSADDRVLHQVGVLVFVDENVPESGIEPGSNLFVVFQQERRSQKKIVEIDGSGPVKGGLVLGVDFFDGLADQTRFAGAVIFGEDKRVLCPTDRR